MQYEYEWYVDRQMLVDLYVTAHITRRTASVLRATV